jgi:hypothetical protein
MRARVDAALTLDAREVPPKVVERLCRMLSFPNPAFLDRLRLGLNPGAELETVCFVEQERGALRLPRGAIHVLRRAAAQDGLIVACEDARVLPEEKLEVPALALRDYQSNAVEKLAKVTQGTVVIPCGGGKTRVGMGAIAKLRTPTLILVHTLDLAEQWLGELKDKLGLEAGLIGDGEERPAPVTVAVIQALVRWEPAKLDAFLGGFGLLILDEAHHVAASTFHSVVDRCPARYRLGLTATPEREDGLTALLDLFMGAPLVTVTHDELVAAGVLTVPDIHSVETDFTYLYTGAEDYAPMLAAVASDPGAQRAHRRARRSRSPCRPRLPRALRAHRPLPHARRRHRSRGRLGGGAHRGGQARRPQGAARSRPRRRAGGHRRDEPRRRGTRPAAPLPRVPRVPRPRARSHRAAPRAA